MIHARRAMHPSLTWEEAANRDKSIRRRRRRRRMRCVRPDIEPQSGIHMQIAGARTLRRVACEKR
jgi:hypothetical protein